MHVPIALRADPALDARRPDARALDSGRRVVRRRVAHHRARGTAG